MPVGHLELPQVIRPLECPSHAKVKVGKLTGKARPCMYTKRRKLIVGHSDKELSIGLASDAFGETGSIPVAPIKMTETEASCLSIDVGQMRKWRNGIRNGLKIRRILPYEFESHLSYQITIKDKRLCWRQF